VAVPFLTDFLPDGGKDSVEKEQVANTSDTDLVGPGAGFLADFSPPPW
jgi:hypothetical protein